MTRKSEREARLRLAKLRAELHGFASIEPETLRSILEHEAKKPQRGGDRELAHTSLFGDGHKQRELF